MIETDVFFQELYKKQFGAPVFQHTGIGTPEFALASWDMLLILLDVTDVYKAFCLVMRELPSFILRRNAISSCLKMNMSVHSWLVPHLLEEQIQSRVSPFLSNPF
jgi:hypothetical protein